MLHISFFFLFCLWVYQPLQVNDICGNLASVKFESSYTQDLKSNQILDCVIANKKKTGEKKLIKFRLNLFILKELNQYL